MESNTEVTREDIEALIQRINKLEEQVTLLQNRVNSIENRAVGVRPKTSTENNNDLARIANLGI